MHLNKSPLVSVIIPVFNAEKFISDCLNSLINQSYKNLEIIVINDGSTDNTIEILESFKEKDIRILLINQENFGCTFAKNKGLEYASGDFVQYLDADDYLSEDKILIQVSILFGKFNSIAVCKTIIFDNCGIKSEIDTELIKKEGVGFDFLMRLLGREGQIGMVQPNAYLIPMNLVRKIGMWDENLVNSPGEDGEYFSRLLICADRVYFSDGANYYRKLQNISSVSKGKSLQNAEGLFLTIKLIFQHVFKINNSSEFKNLYAIHLTKFLYQFGNEYPHFFKIIEKEFLINGIKKYILLENNLFKKITKIIGFKTSMKLKKLLFISKIRKFDI